MTNAPATAASGPKRWLRSALFAAGLAFLAFAAIESWGQTAGIFREMNWGLFALSVLFGVADNVLFSMLFGILLAKYGFRLPYRQVGQMYFFGQVAKYIPGKFWNVIYHSTFSASAGSTGSMLAANLDLTLVALLRNMILCLALVLFPASEVLATLVFLAGSLAFLQTSRSQLASRGINWVLARFRAISDTTAVRPLTLPGRPVIALYFCTWAAFLAANFLVLEAAFGFSTGQAAAYIAYFSLAWVIGAAVFIVPAGMGVREFAFIALAQIFHSQPVSIEFLAAIAILYRVWQLCHEIIGVLVGILLRAVLPRAH